ncbi:hypothetical protein DMH04_26890 [Kibdelosporangium aridum]|uniref:Signal transduction histidine kinase n=1 Tax=Kibdelosporangium aridum TaxID=2030 RepID=A0A428Z582_KIBAR|nr:hypothetical protein [Kibdelosporangium aridum]RSM81972.1 hypothetical protein DMH04_26890 [Kibdelosporangium aridum]
MSVRDTADIIATRFMRGMYWALIGIILSVLFGLELPRLLAGRRFYHSVGAQVVVLVVLVGVVVWVAVWIWRGRLVGWWRWPLLGVLAAVSVIGTVTLTPGERLGNPHWSYEAIGWVVLLLVLDRGVGWFLALLTAHYGVVFALVAAGGQAGETPAGAVNVVMITTAFQVAIAVFASLLRRVSSSVAHTALEQERLRTADEVADQLHADRMDRYAALSDTAAPLLSGLASGALDPGDKSVRRACAVEAVRMRRLLCEGAVVPDPLLHELQACISLAERNGAMVHLSERGERPPVPAGARRRLTEAAVAVLATATGAVRLTMVGTDNAVVLSVVAEAPQHEVPVVDGDGVTTSVMRSGDRLWVEAAWQGMP